jgi:hypothetical protein
MRTRLLVSTALFLAACSGGGGSSATPLADVTSSGAVLDAGVAGACAAGTEACGTSGFCCPTGTACVANPGDTLGCGADYCCLACTAGATCGAGCCASGTSCTANPGGPAGCGTGLCCSPTPEQDPCPPDVAAQCAAGTRCLENRSARFCPGGYACYLPGGAVGCPGETMCPNGADFCAEGSYCAAISGVCPAGSSGGNYCCKEYALRGESCDATQCAPGLSCVDNPHCDDSDPNALRTCKGSCAGQMDCGNFCCNPATTDFCGAPGSCLCMFWM